MLLLYYLFQFQPIFQDEDTFGFFVSVVLLVHIWSVEMFGALLKGRIGIKSLKLDW